MFLFFREQEHQSSRKGSLNAGQRNVYVPAAQRTSLMGERFRMTFVCDGAPLPSSPSLNESNRCFTDASSESNQSIVELSDLERKIDTVM